MRFPGIGPRQAKRFVYFLLRQSPSFHKELSTLIKELGKEILLCESCLRFFPKTENLNTCTICSDKNRSRSSLMVLEKDVDLDNIERARIYDGLYFVLGGTVPILEKNPEKKIHIVKLLERIKSDKITEIILALGATTDGENTEKYVQEQISDITKEKKIIVSHLGRGLSTGSELEYSDTETIKNALESRK